MTGQPSWTRWLVPLTVMCVAAVVRLWGITSPGDLYWDEQYYVFDAKVYLGGGIGQPIEGAPAIKIADEGTWVHPPGGKWIIALLGVGPLGDRPIGWRLPSALFGTAGVALLYLLALRLWRSVWWAGFASLLLALDGLHIVQSRLAMLDIFMSTFVTAGILYLVLDRERMDNVPINDRWPRTTRWFGSPYRLWAGIFLGAAAATKWSGAFALLLAVACCSVWCFTGGRLRDRSVGSTVGTLIASFVMVPLAVYLLTYGSFFYQHGLAMQDFLTLQLRMLRYQQQHIKIQPENSRAWTWPLLLHPIQYFKAIHDGSSSAIVAIGNPALWWAFLLLLPVAAVQILRRPMWQDAVAFGGYAVMFLPWLMIGRSEFIFYMLPAVPFMCLGIVAVLRRLPRDVARIVAVGAACIVVIVAVAFAPVWLGLPASASWLDHLRFLPAWPV